MLYYLRVLFYSPEFMEKISSAKSDVDALEALVIDIWVNAPPLASVIRRKVLVQRLKKKLKVKMAVSPRATN